MVKKLKSIAEKKSSAAAGLLDSQLAQSVRESAQQIWLAGMGAFAKAQEEGGKVFEALVKEGVSLQRKTQGAAEDKLNEVTNRMSAMADSVTAKAGQNWDRLEAIFEQRTAKAMARLGVPSAKDVAALNKRVDELAAALARLSKPAAAKTRKTATARTTRSAAKQPAATSGEPAARPAKRAARKSAT